MDSQLMQLLLSLIVLPMDASGSYGAQAYTKYIDDLRRIESALPGTICSLGSNADFPACDRRGAYLPIVYQDGKPVVVASVLPTLRGHVLTELKLEFSDD